MTHAELTLDEQIAIKEFAARLRDRFPHEVKTIKLYGSKARGEAHKDSDVDLLILVTERTKKFDSVTIDIVCDILDEYGVFLETVTMTEASYQKASDRQYPFAINVERDAIVV